MTRDQWKAFHRYVRMNQSGIVEGYFLARDDDGRLGLTAKHSNGHLIPPAAIANVLGHAARWRHIPSDHAIFIDRVRQLRRRGTWL